MEQTYSRTEVTTEATTEATTEVDMASTKYTFTRVSLCFLDGLKSVTPP
jgi:hypothetical protein